MRDEEENRGREGWCRMEGKEFGVRWDFFLLSFVVVRRGFL